MHRAPVAQNRPRQLRLDERTHGETIQIRSHQLQRIAKAEGFHCEKRPAAGPFPDFCCPSQQPDNSGFVVDECRGFQRYVAGDDGIKSFRPP